MPWAFAEALPLAFKPPFGSLPSLRVHAAVLAIENVYRCCGGSFNIYSILSQNALTGNQNG